MKLLYVVIILIIINISGFAKKNNNINSIKYISIDASFINSQKLIDSLSVWQYEFTIIFETAVRSKEDLQKERKKYVLNYIYNNSEYRNIYIPYKYTQTFRLNLNDTLFNGDYIESFVKTNGGIRVYSSEIFLQDVDYYQECIASTLYTEEEIDTTMVYKRYFNVFNEIKEKQYIKKTTISGDTLYVNLYIDLHNSSVTKY